jgi:hypothetical protein
MSEPGKAGQKSAWGKRGTVKYRAISGCTLDRAFKLSGCFHPFAAKHSLLSVHRHRGSGVSQKEQAGGDRNRQVNHCQSKRSCFEILVDSPSEKSEEQASDQHYVAPLHGALKEYPITPVKTAFPRKRDRFRGNPKLASDFPLEGALGSIESIALLKRPL